MNDEEIRDEKTPWRAIDGELIEQYRSPSILERIVKTIESNGYTVYSDKHKGRHLRNADKLFMAMTLGRYFKRTILICTFKKDTPETSVNLTMEICSIDWTGGATRIAKIVSKEHEVNIAIGYSSDSKVSMKIQKYHDWEGLGDY